MLNLEDVLLDLFNRVEIVDFRLIGLKGGGEPLDVAIVEGAVMSEEEERRLEEIRRRSRLLVALGDCACSGGKFIVKDFGIERVDANLPRGVREFRADPLDKYVKVDYYVYGCPVERREIFSLFKDLLLGKEIKRVSYNVCAECILRENACLLDRGMPCLGPITRGGCGALCPSSGRECQGCRGLAEDANIDSLVEIMKEKGIEVPEFLWIIRGGVRR